MSRSVLVIVLVGLLTLVSFGPQGAAQEAAESSAFCAEPEDVPGQGLSCRVPGGWRVLLGDGTIVLTHGAEVLPIGREASPAVSAPSDPRCVAQGDAGVWPVYAVPSNKANRFGTMAPRIFDVIRQMNGKLNEAAIETNGGDVDYRVVCDGGQVVVWGVQLPTASGSDSFSSIATDLRNAGFTSTSAKHVVFYDDVVGSTNLCGQGTVHEDSTLSPSNANNGGPDFAIAYNAFDGCGSGWSTPMHELAHNLGAVQNDAPRTSGGFHCNDGWDVMCYQDGGPSQCTTGGFDCINTCTDLERFDCGHDTYFHTNPPVGSYLSTHWNLGNSLNRFFSFGSASCTATGTLVVYRDANFLGGCKAFNADDTDFANDFLSDGAWANDEVSSLKVAPGWRVTVYTNSFFGGTSGVFSGNVAGIGSFDDLVSSIHLDPCDANAGVVFYQDINYAGGCKSFNGDDSTLVGDTFSNGGGMNDAITSLRLKPGRIVTLYNDINFLGSSVDHSADVSFVGNSWNDRASSFRLRTVGQPCDAAAIVVVFQHSSFGGACRSFDGNEADLSDNLLNSAISANEQISSMRIRTGFTVSLFSDANFLGARKNFQNDQTFVGNDFNDLATSLSIVCVAPIDLAACKNVPDIT